MSCSHCTSAKSSAQTAAAAADRLLGFASPNATRIIKPMLNAAA
jgi:hypothetical protein